MVDPDKLLAKEVARLEKEGWQRTVKLAKDPGFRQAVALIAATPADVRKAFAALCGLTTLPIALCNSIHTAVRDGQFDLNLITEALRHPLKRDVRAKCKKALESTKGHKNTRPVRRSLGEGGRKATA